MAIKILPEALALDPDRLARFSREAQTLAALSHPNIAHIYGLIDAPVDGGAHVHALVMEWIDGEDLAQRIARRRSRSTRRFRSQSNWRMRSKRRTSRASSIAT